jgi:predicted nucleic acid-binding protein
LRAGTGTGTGDDMIDPPKVLLEHSFLHAVADDQHEQHERATGEYLRLVAEYEVEAVLLVAVSDHLRAHGGFDRRGRFAPVDRLWVGMQHRRAAKRTSSDGDLDLALTLVMAERHRVRTIATFDPRFEQYQLTLLPAPEVE